MALVMLGLGAAGCSSAPPDAELAYCLSSTRQTQLVEAARALGLVEAGTRAGTVRDGNVDLTVEEWRREQPDEFERTCAAIQPVRPGGNEWVTPLFSAVNVVIGAVLALVSTTVSARMIRRRQTADELRAAADALDRSVKDLVESYMSRDVTRRPSAAVLAERVGAVEAVARRVGARLPAAPSPTLLDGLRKLSGELDAPWPDGSAAVEKARSLKEQADSLYDRAERLAAVMDGPVGLFRRTVRNRQA